MKNYYKIAVVFMLVIAVITGCSKNTTQKEDTLEPESSNETTAEAVSGEETASIKDGTYETSAKGKDGDIKVQTVIEGGKITNVTILESGETAGISDGAIEQIPKSIVANNSVNVDAVSGATTTSDAIIEAVKEAIVQAGGNVEDFNTEVVVQSGETKQLSADIVVVGAGSSGMMAAISAADNGANVIVIEKTSSIGGGSLVAWAGKGFDSFYQKELGLTFDKEQIISDWVADCHWRVDAAAIRQYVYESGNTFTWLKDHGLETTVFQGLDGGSLHMLPTDYTSRESLYSSLLDKYVVANGGQYLLNTTGKSLITNDNGEVTGIIAEQTDGTTLEISAKAVILATGGYAGDAEMVKEAFGFEGPLGGLAQNVGEGIKMAWAVGAKVPSNFGGQMLHQTLARATSDLKDKYDSFEASYPLMLTYLPELMNVGKTGVRFRDETATLTAVAAANTSAYQGSFHYVIVSKAQIDALVQKGMQGIKATALPGMPPEFYLDFADKFTLDTPWTNAYEVFDSMVEDGNGFKGNTIEELAKNAGMDVDIFTESFNNYEKFCETGVDTQFNKSKDYLVPMGSEGPYYAIIAEVNNLNSIGGLFLNTNYEVLDEDNLPINGLYAVGVESLGMLYNDTYVGNGVGLGEAFTSGRLAGKFAAEKIK